MLIGEMLRAVLEKRLPRGWVYLPTVEELRLDTPCLFLNPDSYPVDECDDRGIPLEAIRQGFPVEGLDLATIEDTIEWVEGVAPRPSDAVLLESFVYYLRFDAFLPSVGAPPPPSSAEIVRHMDRQFYEVLGPEREDVPCRNQRCLRGAVEQSVFCRVHHFEMVKRKPCPFSD